MEQDKLKQLHGENLCAHTGLKTPTAEANIHRLAPLTTTTTTKMLLE